MATAPTPPPADPPVWTTPLPELLDLLDLRPAGADRWQGDQAATARYTGHVFGGQVAAQAMVAASATVDPDRPAHSMHSYFLRPGDAATPITFEVERVRDGRSFTHRRVRAVQHDRSIMEASFSFARAEQGIAHQVAAPAAPPAAQTPTDTDVLAGLPGFTSGYGTTPDAFELRTVGLGEDWFTTPTPPDEVTLTWMRADGGVPDDPLLHTALLTYASDMRIMHPLLRPHGRSMYDDGLQPATVDHTVWFHAPVLVDQPLLWAMDAPWAGGGRGLCRASVYSTDGVLVATAAQEGLVRFSR